MSEHDHAEFPCARTAELVGQALAAETRRWRLQVALVSAGARADNRRVILDVAEPQHADGDWIRLAGPEVYELRRVAAVDLDAFAR